MGPVLLGPYKVELEAVEGNQSAKKLLALRLKCYRLCQLTQRGTPPSTCARTHHVPLSGDR